MEFVIQRILRDFGKTSAHKQTLINLVVKKANEINETFNTTPEKLMRLNQYLNQLMSPVSSYYAERDWLISIAQITTNYISDLLRVSSEVSIQKKTETKPFIDVYIQRMLNLMNIGTETNASFMTVYHPDPLNVTSYNLPISHTNAQFSNVLSIVSTFSTAQFRNGETSEISVFLNANDKSVNDVVTQLVRMSISVK